jgi:hypothetical protein
MPMTDLEATSSRVQQSEQARQREQAQQIQEQAERIREEALRAARDAQRAAEDAIRQAQGEGRPDVRVIRVPPPPLPPGQEQHIEVRPWEHEGAIPGEVVDIVGMLTFGTAAVLILRPLMRAFANRFERRGAAPAAIPAEMSAQMQRLEQAIEAVAIEVERISEGQRFTTKLLAERAASGKEG